MLIFRLELINITPSQHHMGGHCWIHLTKSDVVMSWDHVVRARIENLGTGKTRKVDLAWSGDQRLPSFGGACKKTVQVNWDHPKSCQGPKAVINKFTPSSYPVI